MTTARRILNAVTFRHVVIALLIGAFRNEIVSVISWAAGIGWRLQDVSTLRAFVLATVQLAIYAALICLALRGIGRVLERRHREREVLAVGEAAGENQNRSSSPGEFEPAGSEEPSWSGEGGGD